jgi:Protein of unknown function (DUF3768)
VAELASSRIDRIRRLNDKLRQTGTGGRVMMTQGIAALPEQSRQRIIDAIRSFDAFDTGNDPYGEHDFGAMRIGGIKAFFKIDYYDLGMKFASPDPADQCVTKRVMTVMLAEEY